MKVIRFSLFSAIAVLLTACMTTPRDVSAVRLGMTKDELVRLMGSPADVRHVEKKNGQTEEVWEYAFPPGAARNTGRDVAGGVLKAEFGFFDDPMGKQPYVFHFIDGQLAHWGPKR